MAGYTRQSRPDITNGADITAPPLNAELDQVETAFGTGGHSHDGTTGNAPKINLATSVSGYLQAVNGGMGGKNNVTATSNPTITDDTGQGYAPGSIWINTSTNRAFLCLSNTSSAAAWHEIVAVTGASTIVPEGSNVDLGTVGNKFRNLVLSGDATIGTNSTIGGTLNVTNTTTLSTAEIVTLNVSGITSLNGNTVIGNAGTDTVAINAEVSTNIVPASTNIDLGTANDEFRDLYIDGTAHIDTLDVDENATVAGTLGVTNNTTLGGTLTVTGNSVLDTADVTNNLDVGGTTTLATVDINSGAIDNTTIGATTHTTGKFTTLQTTNQATLASVNVDGGTIDGTTVGATTASSGAFTTLSSSRWNNW